MRGKVILVTGPIGGGKSTLCDCLREKGYPVYDSDSRTKGLYETVPGLKKRIETVLGIPFTELGRIFGNDTLREKLEALVYPFVLADFERWRNESDSDKVFMESAVALGKPIFEGVFDEVWIVDAPYEQRLARNPKAAERDGLQSFDRSSADVVIVNDGDMEQLKNKLNELI